MSRRLLAALAVACATLVTACDSGPKGPGTMAATVNGSPTLGAVVLDITGDGIQGFEGQGDAMAYSGSLGGQPARYRLVLVSASGGAIHFGIRVADRASAAPVVTVISSASTSNVTVPPAGLKVDIER